MFGLDKLNLAFDRDLMMQYLRNNIGSPAHSGLYPKVYPVTKKDGDMNMIRNWQKNACKAGYPNAHGIPEIANTTSSYVDLCEYIQHVGRTWF